MNKYLKILISTCFFLNGFNLIAQTKKDPDRAFFDLNTLNSSTEVLKYIYDPKNKTGLSITTGKWLITNKSWFDGDGFGLILQGVYPNSKYSLDLKKVVYEDILNISLEEQTKFIVNEIVNIIEIYCKDKKIKSIFLDGFNKNTIKYNNKSNSYVFFSPFDKYSDFTIYIKPIDTYTLYFKLQISGLR